MSWAWMAPVTVAGAAALLCAALAGAVRREGAQVRLARVEVSSARPRLRRAGGPTGPAAR